MRARTGEGEERREEEVEEVCACGRDGVVILVCGGEGGGEGATPQCRCGRGEKRGKEGGTKTQDTVHIMISII
jgi:hypothetical protein